MYGAPFIASNNPEGSDEPQVCFGSDRMEQLAFAQGWAADKKKPRAPKKRVS